MAEATQKTANYTAEMVSSMIEMYSELGNDGLDQIADTLGKSVRSVRSKLVREGVYVASPKALQNRKALPRRRSCATLKPLALMYRVLKALLKRNTIFWE